MKLDLVKVHVTTPVAIRGKKIEYQDLAREPSIMEHEGKSSTYYNLHLEWSPKLLQYWKN